MIKRTRENAIYITQLPDDVNEEKLAELFGSIGLIKVGHFHTYTHTHPSLTHTHTHTLSLSLSCFRLTIGAISQ